MDGPLPGNRLRPRLRTAALAGRVLMLAAASVLLCSCSALGLVYNNADWWLQRSVDRYVALDPVQTAAVHTRIDRLHAWHRAHELPAYADLLEQASARLAHGLRRDDLAWAMVSVQQRWDAVTEQVAVQAAPVLLSLTPSQIAQMQQRFAADNARLVRTQLALDAPAMDRERTEWLTAQFEYWAGDLTAWQRSRIAALAPETADLPASRFAERERRQALFLNFVRQSHDVGTLQISLAELMASPGPGSSLAYLQSVTRYRELFAQMVLDLDRSLSPRQRVAAATLLRRYAAELRSLARSRS
ncbi:MAG TPA: DUF6279 family lipoprotein [Burkholderiales bacterium]|nr:DUF6279 family lipoprotein [Burkholderiales bacterium]